MTRVLGTAGESRTDHELVAACLGGDEAAWHALIDRYSRLIFSIPLKLGMSRDDATDIFQAVCLDLVNELPRLRDPQALPAWLIQVTRHKVLKTKRTSERYVADEAGRAGEMPASDNDMPDALLRELQRTQALRDAVDGLTARCRQMVQMLFFEETPRPYREVAAELGVAVGSIGFLRSRCLDRLRTTLERISL
ncbi:MAG TPA: sigma-70 family RNA polymerase sigma factor [Vicinamibacterales bacterium]|jgi:RNA polymerase sigma factor (sigma-70 family)